MDNNEVASTPPPPSTSSSSSSSSSSSTIPNLTSSPASYTSLIDCIQFPLIKNSLPSDNQATINDGEEKEVVVKKREDYLIWWDYFMSVAYIASLRSKDPNTQVGACIVNESNRIVSLGYNGMPNGCSDDDLPWNRHSTDPLNIKYLYVCHAEMNAIMNKTSYDLAGCTIFVLLFPCNECAKMIIQSGITKVVYLSDKYHDYPAFKASRRLLTMSNVQLCQYTPHKRKIVIDFDKLI